MTTSKFLVLVALFPCLVSAQIVPPDPTEKAIEYRNAQAAFDAFSNDWNQPPPAALEIPKIILDVTDGGPFDQDLSPSYYAGFNPKQMQDVAQFWPFSPEMRQRYLNHLGSCRFYQVLLWIIMSFIILSTKLYNYIFCNKNVCSINVCRFSIEY